MTTKNKLSRAIAAFIIGFIVIVTYASNLSPKLVSDGTKLKYEGYLFAYFPSNDNENIYYALSYDGYNYTPLNGGRRVIAADTCSLKDGLRDPYIMRGPDGCYYMVATDMRCAEGWSSNRGLVLMKSADMINWTHSTVHFPERYKGTDFAHVTRVWAPEVIWDAKAKRPDGGKGRMMVYFSLLTDNGSIPYDKVFYCYANDDFTGLDGNPTFLYDRGSATIDMDIVYNPDDRLYHGFFKNEGEKGICQVTAKTLTAPKGQKPGSQWSKPSKPLQQTKEAVEGAGVFRLNDGKTWVLMYDCYMAGYYQFCSSTDLRSFRAVKNTKTSGMFTPRHGSVLPLTREEIDRITAAFPEHDHASDPVIPGFHADPEVLYSQNTGKYYIYPTTDGFPGWGGHSFDVFESDDLRHFTNRGTFLDLARGKDVAWADGNAWAPCIEEKKIDGKWKYFFYFSGNNPELKKKTIGVAVADSPTGPFRAMPTPLFTESKAGQMIDGDVFTDPVSHQSYLYYGNGRLCWRKLGADMTSVDSVEHDITPRGGTLRDYAFREGVYVFYRKGLYYFLWSVDDTGAKNYHVAYGTSRSPQGPITVAKDPIVIAQSPAREIYGTGHCSVINIPGTDEWRIVFHRINKSYLGNKPGVHREVCIRPLTFTPDGRIIRVEP